MELFTGVVLPLVLIFAGLYFGVRLRVFWLVHPLRTLRTLREGARHEGTSPAAALSLALAGTLGVGNIAGVATAITAGGAGAVLWMLIGAVAAMGVKYAEVYLAVRYRRTRKTDHGIEYFGSAMLYIRDGLASHRGAYWLSALFALLCTANSLLTGNLLQVHAAVSCTPLPPVCFAILFAAVTIPLARHGIARTARLTAIVIPVLTAGFLMLSGILIAANTTAIPRICAQIWHEAWSFRPVAGGVLGLGVSRAVRFGITRGIFSNEAGCGTSPTAHAAANAVSPHHQGCFGIFEVFADTVLLCSITAIVILLYADGEGLDGVPLAIAAYTRLAEAIGGSRFGALSGGFVRLSIVLFAAATVVCQSCYGIASLEFLMPRRAARRIYFALSTLSVLAGAMLSPSLLWTAADLLLSTMTIINVFCLFALRREISAMP